MKEELKKTIYEALKENFGLVEIFGDTIVIDDEDTGTSYGIDIKVLN